MICRRFCIVTAVTFRDIRTPICEMSVYKLTDTTEPL